MTRQYDFYIVNLDPTEGAEMKKTRPCIILSPDEMNQHLRTVQIAPLTSNTCGYPGCVPIVFMSRVRRRAVSSLPSRVKSGDSVLTELIRQNMPRPFRNFQADKPSTSSPSRQVR